MESRTEVAHYIETMTRELCRLCRRAELDDLAYLLEVAAAEAAKVKGRNGARHDGAPPSARTAGSLSCVTCLE